MKEEINSMELPYGLKFRICYNNNHYRIQRWNYLWPFWIWVKKTFFFPSGSCSEIVKFKTEKKALEYIEEIIYSKKKKIYERKWKVIENPENIDKILKIKNIK